MSFYRLINFKKTKFLIKRGLSIVLISNGLQLASWLILFLFVPLFIMILAVPSNENPFKGDVVHGWKLPSYFLVYTFNALKEFQSFKDVFSSLVIPLITAYSLKSVNQGKISYSLKFFLTYLVILLFISMAGNVLINTVDSDEIVYKINLNLDIDTSNIQLRNQQETIRDFFKSENNLKVLQDATSDYVKDCLTYIALTMGISYKSREN